MLKGFQDWVRISWEKSEKNVTLEDGLLFLMEEVGELAEAIRIRKGNKNKPGNIEKELGDCVLAIATLANRFGVDLENACYLTKESIQGRYE